MPRLSDKNWFGIARRLNAQNVKTYQKKIRNIKKDQYEKMADKFWKSYHCKKTPTGNKIRKRKLFERSG